QEEQLAEGQKTFDTTFSINILALSFPLSTALILGILSSGTVFHSITSLIILAASLIIIGIAPMVILKVSSYSFKSNQNELESGLDTPLTENS
ncbi:MAG: permease, partial [Leeuwenhoekiella sp.]